MTATGVPRKSASSMILQNDTSTRRESIRYALGNFFLGLASRKNEKPRRKDNSEQPQSAPPKFHDSFSLPGWNRKYVVSPFQTRRGSFDLARPQETIGDGTDGESFANIEESPQDRSAKAEDSKSHDSRSKATVRWRITIRSQRCANSTSISSEV